MRVENEVEIYNAFLKRKKNQKRNMMWVQGKQEKNTATKTDGDTPMKSIRIPEWNREEYEYLRKKRLDGGRKQLVKTYKEHNVVEGA